MNAHYDFYESLGLDRDSSTGDLRSSIIATLEGLQRDGVPGHDARVQENSVALSVLGDEGNRTKYDARLADDAAPRMGIRELRGLAATGRFPDEQAEQQPAQQQEAQAEAPRDEQPGPYDPVADQAGANATPMMAAPVQAPPRPPMPEDPDNPHLKTLLTSPPGTVKAMAVALVAIFTVSLLALLVSIVGVAAESYDTFFGDLGDLAAVFISAYALPMVGSAVAAAFLLPKVLRGRDNGLTITLIGTAATFLVLVLGLSVTFTGGGTIAVMILLAIAYIAVIVLSFLPDTRAWFNGSWEKPAPSAAAQQYGTPPSSPSRG
ncbi:hypothetical protein ACFWGD_05075 [Corynebacterium sp. NPDC060344]|uniref:hypothetical protein n=1 Tax=Corynebacterium sp. NPDC060344 TaxID=3347101 RepID=UPI00366940EE